MKVYWKVMTKERTSCMISTLLMGLKYPINEWVRPKLKGSRIFIFKSKIQATVFWEESPSKIVPCHALNVRALDICCIDYCQTEDFYAFWLQWNRHKKNSTTSGKIGMDLSFIPKGTLWATAIKCLK